jgi:lysophospholipase
MKTGKYVMKHSKYLVLIALVSLCSCNKEPLPVLSEEPGRFTLTTTRQLQEPAYCQRIEDFYDSGSEGTFKGKADVPIYYKIFRQQGPEQGAILISTGRTEAALKYKELIFDLWNNGYSVYIHDHRGQGLSGRIAEDPELGYIDSFQFYVDDMKKFYDEYTHTGDHEKIYLLAHSMGGAIGITYLEQFPDDFDAAAFSSPMLGLKSPICLLARLLAGKEPKYGPGQTGYQEDSASFQDNSVTGSEIRFYRQIAAYERVPRAKLGGASTLWVHRSCKQFRYMSGNIEKIDTPFILFSAQDEQVVNPDAHREFIEKAMQMGKDCKGYLVEDARHELLMEKDAQRANVINMALLFFDQY